jgi:hypothetical protein
MTTIHALQDAVRDAWASVPAPPADDLKYMAWGWGEEAWQAFVNVAPMDVDIDSGGFFVAEPLLNLPHRAAAAYLGTYLLSLLVGLEGQMKCGLFHDIFTRAHTITCLVVSHFADDVRPFLTPRCREVLVQVIAYLVSEGREALALTQEDVDRMMVSAAKFDVGSDTGRTGHEG